MDLAAALPSSSEYLDAPSAQDLSRCVHCGLCLESCPTYLVTGMETESPRGRIHLIQAVQEGRIEATDAYALHIDRCLVCRACEAVCPSGVPFGRIMETARADLGARRTRPVLDRVGRWLLFDKLLPNKRRLRRIASSLRWYQRSRLQQSVRSAGVLELMPATLRGMERDMPRLTERFFDDGAIYSSIGPRQRRVALFSGCVMPLVYGRVHEATIRVLTRLGCEVVVPRAQVCCGALNVHAGERMSARKLARRNVRAFLRLGVDAVVVNSAGCGSTLKEYSELLEDDPVWAARAERLAGLVHDVSELIATLPFEGPIEPVHRRITIQESCHLVHAQRVRVQPRAILQAIPGLEIVDMAQPDSCCGSAGIYSFLQPHLASQILESKMAAVRMTGVDVIVTANPGCMLQLEAGARAAGLRAEVRHVVELLDWSYRAGDAPTV